MIQLTTNGFPHNPDIDPGRVRLWAIPDRVGLTGTRYGCVMARYGACTLYADGLAIRSSVTPVFAAAMTNALIVVTGQRFDRPPQSLSA